MPDQTHAPLTDERLHQLATDDIVCVQDWVRSMAGELLAARAEIGALRNDLDAKSSDFEAACRHLGEARARITELEATPAGYVVGTHLGERSAPLIEDAYPTLEQALGLAGELVRECGRDVDRTRVYELREVGSHG
ncbi:hypothetical protein [Nocardia cyriacigeorgica]|uniref:hypothetical protein n=1 Tax=Nocardia cyriacigeorgica TaxID=135487 RepID=UPI0024548C66|nr:hypothetical protein [Nocardia cyriacigeorgica]